MEIPIPQDYQQPLQQLLAREDLNQQEREMLSFFLGAIERFYQEQALVKRLLESGTREEIEEAANTVSPGFFRFQLLSWLAEREDGA